MPGRKHILFNLSLFLCLGVCLTITIAYWQIEKLLLADIEQRQSLKYQTISNAINRWETDQLKLVSTLGATLSKFGNIEKAKTNLEFYIEETIRNHGFEYLVVGLENGFYLSNPWNIPEDYDHRTRPWYQATQANLKALVVGPIFSILPETPDKTYIAFSAPIIKNGRFIGAVSGDISNTFLRKMVLSKLIGNDQNLFIINQHREVALNEGSNPELGQAIAEFETLKHQLSPTNTSLEGRQFSFRIYPMDKTGWQLVFPFDKDALKQTLLIDSLKLAGWFALIFFVLVGAVTLYNRQHLTPLLRYYANDENTGLMGKKSFKFEAEQHISNKEGPALVLIVSVNKFGALLTAHGHKTMDGLLRQTKNRIDHYLSQDALFAFFSEGRFIIYAPFDDIRNVTKVNNWLHGLTQTLSAPYKIYGKENLLSFSVGASRYPLDGNSIETLPSQSFTAINRRGKKEISDYYLFAKEDSTQVAKRVLMTRTLPQGIHNNELYMVYQPQFCTLTNEVVGVESLVRWYSSQMQREVYPDEFIPLAEESDLVLVLGQWVINAVIKQIAEWQQQGHDFGRVAINISPEQLLQPNFTHDTLRCLEHYQVSPEKICLEITETHIISDPEKVSGILHELKAKGITIAIDDFGTGYSSLEYLKKLPANKIKIDRSFIQDIDDNQEDLAITQLIISIANVFDFEIIAEGVETPRQLEILLDNGCSEVQGYFFSKPMKPEQLVNRFSQATTT